MKRTTFLLFFLLIFSTNTATAANSCNSKNFKAVDLSNKFCEVRDQDSTGWCYAFSTSDLLDYERSDGNMNCSPENRTSPASLAINYVDQYAKEKYQTRLKNFKLKKNEILKDKKIFEQGGIVSKTVMAAYKTGVCSEAEFPSEDFTYVCKDCNLNKYINLLLLPKLQKQNDCTSIAPYVLDNSFKNIEQIRDFLQFTQAVDLIKKYESLRCSNRTIYEKPKNLKGLFIAKDGSLNEKSWSFWKDGFTTSGVSTNEISAQQQIINAVNMALDINKPAAVSIGSSPLLHGKREPTKEDPEGLGKHSVLITGRKCENGKIKYLIRNSWGKGCATYKISLNKLVSNCQIKHKVTQKKEQLKALEVSLKQNKNRKLENCENSYQPVIRELRKKRSYLYDKYNATRKIEFAKQGDHMNEEISNSLNQLTICKNSAKTEYANKYNTALNHFNKIIEDCNTKAEANKETYQNPNVTCKDSIVSVTSSELKKYIYGVDYFE